jgi:hypothetical protein
MNEKKDFKYVAQDPVVVSNEENIEESTEETEEVEINDVVFLTPTRIEYTKDGVDQSVMMGIDLINKKAYVEEGVWDHSDAIFEHLDRINTLPEDFFEAGEDIYNKANKAVDEMEDIRKSALDKGDE